MLSHTMLHGQLMLRSTAQNFLDRGWILLMTFVDFRMISASILKHKIVIDDPKSIQNLYTCAHGKKSERE
jgi:hypothetical protein